MSLSRISLVIGCALVGAVDCTSQSCTESVGSAADARHAVSAFFASQSTLTRSVIAELRRDGMTDEFLARLRNECSVWYVYRGNSRIEDSDKWYAAAQIAPFEENKL